jgi:hypothetical protein
MADANARAKAFPCTTQDDACAQQIISTLGAKAFRRPLSDLESARLLQRYTDRATLTETGSWDEGMTLVVEGIFSSPNYLTRAETTEQADGDRFQLSGYEVASRLSFMLWDSMPDQALFDAAAAGTLNSNAGIAEQAARMLADPRAHAPMAEFHKGYLHMGPGTRWQNYTRDKATYPSFNDATMPPALEAETAAFLDSVTFSGGSFLDLMTSTTGFVSADTAALYGLNPADFGATPTQVDLGAGRPGILTRAGFLAANSYADRASPIHRGAFIQKEVLCTVIGTPPPGAAGTPLPTDAALVTNRQRVDAQTAATGCTECHHPLVNPTGFAFEGFDATGAVQTMDGTAAIDTAADVIIGGATVTVAGAADLVNAIANSTEAQRCYTRKLAEFAYDRALDPADVCTIDSIAPKLAQDGYTIANLITDLTQTDYFRYRALETEVAQ